MNLGSSSVLANVAPTPFVVFLSFVTLDGPDFSLLDFTGFCPSFKLRTCTSVNGIGGNFFCSWGQHFSEWGFAPNVSPNFLRCNDLLPFIDGRPAREVFRTAEETGLICRQDCARTQVDERCWWTTQDVKYFTPRGIE